MYSGNGINSIKLFRIITNSQTSRAARSLTHSLSGDVSRGSLHTASCFPSHAIMAHRLEFFDGTYVTKMYVYVSLE